MSLSYRDLRTGEIVAALQMKIRFECKMIFLVLLNRMPISL